jgi:signal peptidase I
MFRADAFKATRGSNMALGVMKRQAFKLAGAIALFLVLSCYFWNPFNSPTWNPLGRLSGRQYFKTPGEGMQPTYEPGSKVLVCFDVFKNHGPRPNDIVVFRVPGDEGLLYLKRVAAVAGSTIEIRDSVLRVDGHAVSSPFWWAGDHSSPYTTTLAPIQLPPDTFFALGDNIENSIDSRRFGPVPFSSVVGGLCDQQAFAADVRKTRG